VPSEETAFKSGSALSRRPPDVEQRHDYSAMASAPSRSARTFLSKTPPLPFGTINPKVFMMPRIWFDRSVTMVASWPRAPTSAFESIASELDAHLAVPAGSDDVCKAFGVVGVGLVRAHFERALRVARVQSDHRQAASRELGPQPSGEGTGLEADAFRLRGTLAQDSLDVVGMTLTLAAPHALAVVVEHVDLCLIHRDVETYILSLGCERAFALTELSWSSTVLVATGAEGQPPPVSFVRWNRRLFRPDRLSDQRRAQRRARPARRAVALATWTCPQRARRYHNADGNRSHGGGHRRSSVGFRLAPSTEPRIRR